MEHEGSSLRYLKGSLDSMLGNFEPLHIITAYFSNIYVNSILLPRHRSSKCFLPLHVSFMLPSFLYSS